MKHSTLALCVMAAIPAFAADTGQPRAAIEEITVSARKIDESVQTVPISMSAMSGDEMENQSIRNINDIQAQVPNLFLQTHPSDPQALSLSIRGQRQNDILLTLDPSVGIYIDNLYYPRTMGLRSALVDVERVEVLRGPQGTLYGRNTTGGAMSIYTKNPTDALGGSLALSAGNFSAREVKGIANIPLTDTAALRLVAQKADRDGYGENAFGDELEDEDSQYLRAKLRLDITPEIQAILFGSYHKNETGGDIRKLAYVNPNVPSLATRVTVAQGGAASHPAALALLQGYVGGDFYETDGTFPMWSDFEGHTLGFDLTADLGNGIEFRAITGYEKFERDNSQDGDGTPFAIVEALRTTEASYLSQEFQLLGGGDDFNWVTGIYYGHEDGEEWNASIVVPNISPTSPTIYAADVDNRSYAVFGQANWEFMPDWRLTLGARYSWDEREIDANNSNKRDGCIVPAPGVPVTGIPANPANGPSQCPRNFSDDFSDPSWLVSLDHQLSEDVMVYGKVAYGYRTGGRNMRGVNYIENLAAFDPETVTEYELGFKSEFLDRRVRLNMAFFYDDYEDIQRSTTVPIPGVGITTVVANAAAATVKGIEAELQMLLTEGWSFRAGYGWTDMEYDEFFALADSTTILDRSGETFGVPEKSANISTRYALPMQWGEVAAQVDYQWQDEYITVPEVPTKGPLTQQSFGLVNARLTFAIDSMDADISLFGKNLADEEYIVGGGNAETSVGYTFVIPGEPRTYGISFTKRLGDF
jgi:iron complex outermembrane receptor protein